MWNKNILESVSEKSITSNKCYLFALEEVDINPESSKQECANHSRFLKK